MRKAHSCARAGLAVWLALIVAASFSLTGCGGGSSQSNPLVSLTLSDGSGDLAPYEARQLHVVGTYRNGTEADLTGTVRYSSTADYIVAIGADGKAVGLAPGLATVTALEPESGISTQLDLNVKFLGPATLDSITLRPAMSLSLGEAVYLIVSGNYSDGTLVDFSSQAAWFSDRPLVAPVDTQGKATGSATGTTTLFAQVVDPDNSSNVQIASASLQVGLAAPGNDGVRDWIHVLVGTQEAPLVQGLVREIAAGGEQEPHSLTAHYTETFTLMPVVLVQVDGNIDAPSAEFWVAGNTVGQYDVTTSARFVGTAPQIPGSMRAGPDVPGSSGTISITRLGSVGGRVHGFADLLGCRYFGEVLVDCGWPVRSTFSIRREDDNVFAQEGNPTPVNLTVDVPYAGRVDTTSSHYLATGLTGSTGYFIRADNASTDVTLEVATDAAFTDIRCTSATTHPNPEVCAIVTDSVQTELHVRVTFVGPGTGAIFRVSVSSSPYPAENPDPGDPLDLGMVPVIHNGTVDNTASHYVVGVPTSTAVAVRMVTGEGPETPAPDLVGTLEVFEDAAFSVPFCTTAQPVPSLQTCGGVTGAAVAQLYLRVTGDSAYPGQDFTLSATAHPNEGSAGAPTVLALRTTRASTVGVNASYYTIATQAGQAYEASLTNPDDDLTLVLYEDAFITPVCTSAETGIVTKTCMWTATGSALNVKVDGSATTAGAGYGLVVRPIFPSEGTEAAPLELTVGVAHAGSAGMGETSYYAVNVSLFSGYTIAVRPSTQGETFIVYGDAALSSIVCEFHPGEQSNVALVCPVQSGLYDRLYLTASSALGADFAIFVAAGLLTEESTFLTPGEVHYGTVGLGSSSFQVLALPGEIFDVTLTDASDNVSLKLYGGVSGDSLLCSSDVAGTGDEQCTGAAGLAGFTIKVDGANTQAGAEFVVTVSQPRREPEGSVAAPVSLVAGENHEGYVDDTTSYYSLPTTAGTAYAITLNQVSTDLGLKVYSASDFSGVPLCDQTTEGIGEAQCIVAAPGTALYVAVTGPSNEPGAAFMLTLLKGEDSEGTPGSPVVLIASAPHPGHVSTTASYYQATVTAGGLYTVSVAGPSDNVSLTLYEDSGFASPLCQADGPGNLQCQHSPVGTTLYLQVSGENTLIGAVYTITVSPIVITELTPNVLLPQTSNGGYMYYSISMDTGLEWQFKLVAGDFIEAALANDPLFNTIFDFFSDGFWPTYPPGFLQSPTYIRVDTSSVGPGFNFEIGVEQP